MTPSQIRLAEQCQRRGVGPRVRDRIIRLNPIASEGAVLRGWHPATTARYLMMVLDLVPKGEFIRRHGRAAWEALPNGIIHKYGRRRYVDRVSYLDNVWKVWAGMIPPCELMVWFPTKRFANDNQLEIEYISGEEFLRRRAA